MYILLFTQLLVLVNGYKEQKTLVGETRIMSADQDGCVEPKGCYRIHLTQDCCIE